MLLAVPNIASLLAAAGCSGALHAVRLNDGAEVAHDCDQPQVMASVVKVPIGLEFYSRVAEGTLDGSQLVTVSPTTATPGPVGISRFSSEVTVSLRDLSYLMLTISDNAATDVITRVVGIDAINERLRFARCTSSTVVSDLATMLDRMAADLGFSDYEELLSAQSGDLGPEARAASTDPEKIDRCPALDPALASRTTARDATRLLESIWADTAGPAAACAVLRSVMAEQVTRRLAPAVMDGGAVAAKSGALFGRVRNEIGVITDPDGAQFAVAVFTRAHEAFVRQAEINAAMAAAVRVALGQLRPA